MKRFSMIISFVLLCSFLCTGCRDTHRHYGEYPEYFSIAINSLLGVSGGESDKIEVLEQDSNGRILFLFTTNMWFGDKNGLCSLMICQKTDEKYAYFYPDYHFVLANTKEEFTKERTENLKIINDWNQEMDDKKLTKVKIERTKDIDNYAGSQKTKIFEDKDLVDFEIENIIMTRLGVDKEKRGLYYVDFTDKEHNYLRSYMLILNEDYSYEDTYLEEIEDVWNYQEQLKEFKELNNWSLYVE